MIEQYICILDGEGEKEGLILQDQIGIPKDTPMPGGLSAGVQKLFLALQGLNEHGSVNKMMRDLGAKHVVVTPGDPTET